MLETTALWCYPDPMPEWKSTRIAQWDALRERAAQVGWPQDGSLSMIVCGEIAQVPWFAARSTDCVAEFLALSGAKLVECHHFGVGKVDKLIRITRACLIAAGCEDVPGDSHDLSVPRPVARPMLPWEVPLQLPIAMLSLPTRVRNFCSYQRLDTLDDLLSRWNGLGGEEGVRLHAGREAALELKGLYDALRSADYKRASRWLPLAPDRSGLSLWLAISYAVAALPVDERDALELRVVYRRSAPHSSIRQVEARLRKHITRWLDWFPDERDALKLAWMVQDPALRDTVKQKMQRLYPDLVLALLGECFEAGPDGDARAKLEAWHSMLRKHPDMQLNGIELEPFLLEHVPCSLHERLRLSISRRGRIAIDLASGRVGLVNPSLREVAWQIVRREKTPLSLTRLTSLVQQVPFMSETSREQIASHRAKWARTRSHFPVHMVEWDE